MKKEASLRAHHLNTLLTARRFKKVEDYAVSEVEAIKRSRLDKDDLIGPDGVYANPFIEKICNAVETYENLPDDNQIVVNGEPDLFCSACYKGEHCLGKGFADVYWLNEFIDFVRSHSNNKHPKEAPLKKGYGDEMLITTTAAIIRAFLDSRAKYD